MARSVRLALLLLVAVAAPLHAQHLSPYTPQGWSDKIVVSSAPGGSLDTALAPADSLYVDWAVINDGAAPTTVRFFTELLVDGAVKASYFSDPPLNPGFYIYVQDVAIGSLAAGTHTVTIRADTTNTIPQAPSEKQYTKTIVVGATTGQHLSPYQPQGWSDKIVVSKEQGTRTDSSPLSPGDTLYVDWAVINDGTAATAVRFFTDLLVDGVVVATFYSDPPVAAGFYVSVTDYPIGSLSPGTHTVSIRTDTTGTVAQSQAEKQYTRTITVAAPGGCAGDPLSLCLLGGRFQVKVTWRNQHASPATTGVGTAVPSTDQTGYFWFFSPDNIELAVKVVDGRFFNQKYWVFYGALSDVEYTITVTDKTTGAVRTYRNTPGDICGRADTEAFAAAVGTVDEDPLEVRAPGGVPLLGTAVQAVEAAGAARSLTSGASAPEPLATCSPSSRDLCLFGGRFRVSVAWNNQHSPGQSGLGTAVPFTDQSGTFWFFDAQNIELVVKIVDGRSFNQSYWFFYGALSDVEYTITVTDTGTGAVNTYRNPPGNVCGRADITAFPGTDPPPPPPGQFTVTAALGGTGSGTVVSTPAGISCPGTCSAPFTAPVTLRATAAAGSTFLGWSGGGCAGTQPCVVSTAQTVTAHFGVPLPTDSVSIRMAPLGSGQGTVTSTPAGLQCPPACGANFPKGTTVTLHAVAGPGSTFFGWGADCLASGSSAQCAFPSIPGSRWVTAIFNAPPPANVVADSIAALYLIENQARMAAENFPLPIRGAAELYNPEVVALISAGAAAVDPLLAQFQTPAGPPDDLPLCLFAYALERIGDRRAAKPLADWLARNLSADLDFARDFATHAIKVLSGQSGLNLTTFTYLPDEMLDAIALAGAGGAASAEPPMTQARAGASLGPDPLSGTLPQASAANPDCSKTLIVTGLDAQGRQKTIKIPIVTKGQDFADEIAAQREAGNNAKADAIAKSQVNARATDDYFYEGSDSDYRKISGGDVSKKGNCGGTVTERLINNVAAAKGQPLRLGDLTTGADYVRDLAREFGDDITDDSGKLDTFTVISHNFQSEGTNPNPNAASKHVEIPVSCNDSTNSCVVYSKDNQGYPRLHTVSRPGYLNFFRPVVNKYNFRPFYREGVAQTDIRLYRLNPNRIISIAIDSSTCPCDATGGGALPVTIAEPSGTTTTERVVTVSGTVGSNDVTFGTMRINNTAQNISVSNGSYSVKAVLSSGMNTIKVVIDSPDNRRGCAEKTIDAQVPKTTISATLTWSLGSTDVDLYVTQPDNQTSWYRNKTTSIGGRLDVDNTSGFGPENYFLSSGSGTTPPGFYGVYTIRVHYYNDHAKTEVKPTRPVSWRVDLLLNEGTPREKREVFSGILSADSPTNNSPGATGPDWATATSFTLAEPPPPPQ